MNKVRFITGTDRGIGGNIAKAVPAAWNAVIATGITKEAFQ
jgi:NAD(P)-dependent dehydrogenase (short-subunit alcohol dehydrogenase family)